MSMLCHTGEMLSRQLDKTLSLMSQFAYVHNDSILLGLAVACHRTCHGAERGCKCINPRDMVHAHPQPLA